jgi:hypothetical protein
MFFIKKKKLTFHAYAPIGQLVDLFPPTTMEDNLPDWYKSLPADLGHGLTVKHCPGLKDLFPKTIVMPLWADYEVTTSMMNQPDVRTSFSPPGMSPSVSHNLNDQVTGAWPAYSNIKFSSPWMFWCDEPIPCLVTQAVWHQKDPSQLQIVPGILEFRHQHQTNINTIIRKDAALDAPIMLRAGTPMVYITPLTERDWDLNVDTWNQSLFAKLFAKWDFAITNGSLQYQRVRNLINRK